MILLVIVDYFNLVGIAGLPSKADSPLIVDSDAVCSGTLAFERLQAVTRRHT
jgi:hypothetical protein